MRVRATADVSGPIRRQLVQELAAIGATHDGGSVHLKAAEPPSYVEIVARAVEWITPFKAAATVFLAQLAKEAAKDAWANKAEIADALKNAAAGPLRVAAQAIGRALRAASRHPDIHLGVGDLEGVFGTFLVFKPEDEVESAWVLARFVVHAETIERLIKAEVASGRGVLGPAQILLEPNGRVRVVWLDYYGNRHEKVLE
jgi:hypothetical protein